MNCYCDTSCVLLWPAVAMTSCCNQILMVYSCCTPQTLVVLLYCTVYHCGWCRSDNGSDNNAIQLLEVYIYTFMCDDVITSFMWLIHRHWFILILNCFAPYLVMYDIQCYIIVHVHYLEINDLISNDKLVSFLRQFQNYFPANFDLNNAVLFLLYFR